MTVFISHDSEDKPIARRLEQDLRGAAFDVWIDHANLRVGQPLVDAIQQALRAASTVVVLWSARAAESRYVKFEWQAAVHIDKPMVPCRLDATELPLFLQTLLICDLSSYDDGFRRLLQALGGSPARPKALAATRSAPPTRSTTRGTESGSDVSPLIHELHEGQHRVLTALIHKSPAAAAPLQAQLDPVLGRALEADNHNAMVLNLAGFQKKNAYMIDHWKEIQTRQAPEDRQLEEAEEYFYEALSIEPEDASALNGLGSILMLRRDLDAAEFFIRRALDILPGYEAAEHDLKTVLALKDAERR